MSGYDEFVVENNPFRWKGYYCDLETGLYYIDGRYYSPEIMQYLDADVPENLITNAFILNSLDRNAITVDNSISFLANQNSIFTSLQLYPDPLYDENAGKSWWSRYWKETLAAATFFIGFVLMCIPVTEAFGMGMLAAGFSGAVSGFVIGGVIGGLASSIHGNGFIEGFAAGAISGFIDGFIAGAWLYCASQALGSIIKPAIKTGNAKDYVIADNYDDALAIAKQKGGVSGNPVSSTPNNYGGNDLLFKRTTKAGGKIDVKILEHMTGHPARGMSTHLNVYHGVDGKNWHIFFRR